MKVIMTIPGLDLRFGGPSRTVPALCGALHARGVEVELVTLGSPQNSGASRNGLYSTVFIENASNRYLPFAWAKDFRAAVTNALNESDGVLLHDHGLWLPSNHFAAALAQDHNVPFVISSRGMLSPWALNAKKWRKRIAWMFYQKRDVNSARMLHATSQGEADELRALRVSPTIAVIPNGIDLPNVNEEVRQSVRRTVLFLSRIHPKKGLLDLVHAWARLRPNGWRVIVAGNDDGSYQSKVQAAVAAAGVQRDFEFIGPVVDERKWELYSRADLFVLPSYSENFGVVIGEALASGLPVITTRATPWAAIQEQRCGWWIDARVDALVSALREALLLSDAERREMGRRGREFIRAHYSWSSVAAQMCLAYEWLLGKAGKPTCVK